MNPDDSDVSRQDKTGRNIDDIHSIDGSLVMTGVTADDDDDDDREGNAHVMMMQMLMLSILTMTTTQDTAQYDDDEKACRHKSVTLIRVLQSQRFTSL